jgi:hypothetical protein
MVESRTWRAGAHEKTVLPGDYNGHDRAKRKKAVVRLYGNGTVAMVRGPLLRECLTEK